MPVPGPASLDFHFDRLASELNPSEWIVVTSTGLIGRQDLLEIRDGFPAKRNGRTVRGSASPPSECAPFGRPKRRENSCLIRSHCRRRSLVLREKQGDGFGRRDCGSDN